MDLIMGMNSGSSFDGIDVVLAETEMDADGFPKAPKFLKGGSYQWPEEAKQMVLQSFDNKLDMVALNRLNYIAGAVFAEKACQFMKENSLSSADIKVLGLDTQTLYQEQPDHQRISEMTGEEKADWPGRWLSKAYPAGYQVGDTSVIANLTNITTVTHFRQADHTFGGSAAPLMPYLDFCLFRKKDKPVMTLNIGGIANLHVACSDRSGMYGFDTGPGNVQLDYCAEKLFHQPCDYDGKIAASGKVNDKLLRYLMEHPFFKRPVPRSGWRLDFAAEYNDKMLAAFSDVRGEDVMATLCAFTASAIVKSMFDNVPKDVIDAVENLYVSGGGMRNPQILGEITARLPANIRLSSSAEIGIPPEFKEAVKFATIAYSTIHCAMLSS